MSLVAIIPIKPLNKGKSRLSSVFNEKQRIELNTQLLKNTIRAIKNIQTINQIFVISSDPNVLSIARDLGTKTIQEQKSTNINRALRKATKAALAYKADKIIIIPADLPLINEIDIISIIDKMSYPPQIIIVPDRKDSGTNILLINPIGILDFEFGSNSFIRHIEQAQRKNIRVDVVRTESLGLDVDSPDDYLEVMKKTELLKYKM